MKKKFRLCNKMFCCSGARGRFGDTKWYLDYDDRKYLCLHKNSVETTKNTIDYCMWKREYCGSYNRVFHLVIIFHRQQAIRSHQVVLVDWASSMHRGRRRWFIVDLYIRTRVTRNCAVHRCIRIAGDGRRIDFRSICHTQKRYKCKREESWGRPARYYLYDVTRV